MDNLEFIELFKDTKLTTKEIVEKYLPIFIQNGYITKSNTKNQFEIERLKMKYPKISDSSIIMKTELLDYLHIIISQIKQNYESNVPVDRIKSLEQLLNPDNIIVINNPNDKHDISVDSEKGQIIVNLSNLSKGHDIYSKIAIAKGCLPHETFHFLIKMLKNPDLADDRMIINLISGERITFRGMVGFILNEGLAEKMSNEFCERNALYYNIAPQYIPYVNISTYILNKNPELRATIFSSNYENILEKLSNQEREIYLSQECISYAVRHKGIKSSQIAQVKIEKVLNNQNKEDFTQNLTKEEMILIKEQLENFKQVPCINEHELESESPKR